MRFTVEKVIENLREHVGHVHAINEPNAVAKATRRGLINAEHIFVVHAGNAPTEPVNETVVG
jgi:hypothetical protein